MGVEGQRREWWSQEELCNNFCVPLLCASVCLPYCDADQTKINTAKSCKAEKVYIEHGHMHSGVGRKGVGVGKGANKANKGSSSTYSKSDPQTRSLFNPLLPASDVQTWLQNQVNMSRYWRECIQDRKNVHYILYCTTNWQEHQWIFHLKLSQFPCSYFQHWTVVNRVNINISEHQVSGSVPVKACSKETKNKKSRGGRGGDTQENWIQQWINALTSAKDDYQSLWTNFFPHTLPMICSKVISKLIHNQPQSS